MPAASDQLRPAVAPDSAATGNWLSAVLSALPVGVAITDARGVCIQTNAEFERIWKGLQPIAGDAVIPTAHKAWWADTGKPVQPDEWASARAVNKGETVTGQVLEIQRPGGVRGYIVNSAAPLRDNAGRIVGSAVAIQDITELRQTQAEITHLASFPMLNPQPVVEADMEGQVHFMNPAARQLFPDLKQLGPKHPWLAGWNRVAQVCRQNGGVISGSREITLGDSSFLQSICFTPHRNRVRIYGVDITARKRAQEALQQLNAELERRVAGQTAEIREKSAYNRRLIETSPDPLVTIGPDGKITDVNTATEKVTGRSRAELIGTDFLDYFTEPERAHAGYQQVFKEGCISDYPLEIRHRDGHVTSVIYNASVYRDAQGKVAGVFAAARDITQRKRAEELVLAERQRLYDVLETLPVYVVLLAQDHRMPFANRFFRERFGVAGGKRCFERLFNRSAACQNCESFKALQTKAPHHWEWTGPDGRSYQIHDFPFTDSDGSPMIMEMGLDITDVRQAQAALQQLNETLEQRVADRTAQLAASEQRLRQTEAIAHLGSWELDIAGGRLAWSDEVYRIFGLAPREFAPTYAAFLERVHPDDRAAVDEAYHSSVRENRDSYEVEHRIIRKDNGAIRTVHEKCEHSRDAGGRIIRSVGMVHDITEPKWAEAVLRRSHDELEQMVKERTAALADSERKYRELVETANSVILRITPDNTITFLNEYAQRLFGFTPEELLGRNAVGTIIPAVDSAGRDLGAMMRSITVDPDAYAINENENICKNGKRVWVHWSNRAVRDEQGRLVEILCVGTDVTARKQSEEHAKVTGAMLALFARKTTRRDYLEAVTDLLQQVFGCRCIGIRIRNDNGEIPYEASKGFTPEFLASESRLCPDRDACVCARIMTSQPLPCDRAALSPGGSFFCNDTAVLFNTMQEADRQMFRGVCVKYGFASLAVLPISYQGRTLGVVHLADERPDRFPSEVVVFIETIIPLVGEALQRFDMETKLRKNEERYRSLVIATAQIVWTTNTTGEVADDLPDWRKFTGQSREEIRGQGWIGALHPDDRQRTAAVWEQAVATRSLYKTEYRLRRFDGCYLDFAVRGVPVIAPDGTVREWVGTCTDISQQKAMEAETARYQERLRGLAERLAASEEQERWQISRYIHDTIIQNLSLASMKIGAAQKILPAVRLKTDGVELQTTRVLVDNAIAECRTVMSDLTPSLLYELGLVPALRELADKIQQQHGVQVFVAEEGEAVAMAIPIRGLIFQSVRELIMNALKHAGPRLVRVTVTGRKGEILIRVQDDGAGFDPGKLERRDPRQGGFGLFGIRQRIESLKGRLAIESAPGKGATAVIMLPVEDTA